MAPSDRHPRKQASTGCVWLGLFAVAAAVIAMAAYTTLKKDDEAKKTAVKHTASASPRGSVTAITSASPSPSSAGVTVAAGGDLMADQGINTFIESDGAEAVLAGVAPVLEAADVAFISLESPLSDIGKPKKGKEITFEGDPRMVDGLVSAGVDVVTMANNHAMDYGDLALLGTIRRLGIADVGITGAGKDVDAAYTPSTLTTESGATVAFLGFSDIIPQDFLADSGPGIAGARIDIPRMITSIKTAARNADFVVVSFHWGVEYDQTANADQVAEAYAAVDAGADLVLASHPHVLQGLETYNGALIAYSLGDLVYPQAGTDGSSGAATGTGAGETMIVTTKLSKKTLVATLTPVAISADGIPAVVTGSQAATILKRVKELSAELKTEVTITGDVATITIKER